MAVPLAVASDVFDSVIFCAVLFPHEMSWMRSGTELSHFLWGFPTFSEATAIQDTKVGNLPKINLTKSSEI